MEERESDIVGETEERMERAQDSGDKERLETLEEVHSSLESELDEGAETPPA